METSAPPLRPIQRRLEEQEVDQLVARYRAGSSLDDLAREFRVHRRTAAGHLEQRGIERRGNMRKLSRASVADAVQRYRAGDSLATLGRVLDVDAATVGRELRRELGRAPTETWLARIALPWLTQCWMP